MARRRRRGVGVSPTYLLKRNALRKGVLGGNKSWMVLFVFLYTPGLMRRLFGRTEVMVAREPMRSGQILRIEALGDLSKAERKTIRRSK